MSKLIGIVGILVILGIAFAASSNRKAVNLRIAGAAFALQVVVAVIVLYTDWGSTAIDKMSAMRVTAAFRICSGEKSKLIPITYAQRGLKPFGPPRREKGSARCPYYAGLTQNVKAFLGPPARYARG